MTEEDQTFIIIPDISGFSSFVNEVAISHAEHIIRELLDIILESNDLGLEVSEIEGDAVLFYKTGDLPDPSAILSTVETMYIRFHEHLALYEQNRICQCGACRTAHELTLKVIVDQGPVKKMKVKNHTKLVGPALIAAHRLLKNDIPSSEYLLLSERYVDYQKCLDVGHQFDWINWEKGCNHYEDVGEVNYHYTLLSPLNERVRKPEERRVELSVNHPIILSQSVRVNYRYAHHVLTDSQKKEHWIQGLDRVIKQSQEEIERIGSKHLCVIGGGSMLFEAIDSQEKENELEYMEVLQKFGPLKDIAMIYRCINQGDNKCRIQVEMHYDSNFFLKPLVYMAMQMAKRQMRQSLKNLKTYLETTYDAAAFTSPAKTAKS